ncbi:MAG: 4-(cytidine 5'-diphospho)-2-C-methyl-D-erythritol kinase [Solirubrobacteraceae bacterium]
MSALAPGKLNLCLFLGERRGDARHELVTLLESVSLADELTLSTPAPGPAGEGPDRVSCPGVEGPNLAARALAELRLRGWSAPPVALEIRKRVPVAGGMGGGSADAAAVLRLAGALEPIAPDVLWRVAVSLGADVPSQLAPGLVLGTGAGEIVAPLDPLAPHALLIVALDVGLSTPEVYREADRLGLPRCARQLGRRRAELTSAAQTGVRLAGRLLVNDLAPAALSLCPEIADSLAAVRQAGAEHALVCGSGPTVAGLYWGDDARARASAGAAGLAGRFVRACAAVPVSGTFGSPVLAP